jgi:hypothetical protein
MDVHKDSIAVAYAAQAHGAKVIYLEAIGPRTSASCQGGFGRLPTGEAACGESVVAENGAAFIAHPERHIVAREYRMSHTNGFLRDDWNGLRMSDIHSHR